MRLTMRARKRYESADRETGTRHVQNFPAERTLNSEGNTFYSRIDV